MGAIIENKENANYRDRIATVDAKGRRKWIYAKAPKGKLTTYRRALAYVLIAVLFVTPFLKIGGNPVLLFNVLERKFVLFGTQFFPQDFHLAFIAMITLIVFIILFTVVFGRLWCGWACPQTIFMEFVFRQIEYWIEGSPAEQRKLNTSPWDTTKVLKKTSKHVIFYAIAFLISNVFLSYIIGIENLRQIVTDNPLRHLGGLTAMVAFSGMFYFIFAFFREQVCTLVCPYGRLQGVLLDSNSIAVMYDPNRGETRAPLRKNTDRKAAGHGDCIDCKRCVQVCPTGIDIRNGSQLECVNCTACIDECNSVMTSLNLAPDLIRYDSVNGIRTGKKLTFTPRNVGYSVVLVILMGVFGFVIGTKSEVEAVLVRTYNTQYQQQPNNQISNMYNYKLVNKSTREMPLSFHLVSHKGEIRLVGSDQIRVQPGQIKEGVLFVVLPADLVQQQLDIRIALRDNEKEIEQVKLSFVGPMQ